MDMIKKIAFTASTMLFVLAQIFSFYVIFTSHKEKINLLKEKENNIFQSAVSELNKKISKSFYRTDLKDHIMIYYFRDTMPENTALYNGEKELYNSSPYEFEISQMVDRRGEELQEYKVEKYDGKYLLVFYEKYWNGYFGRNEDNYIPFYVVDVTYIYEESWNLVVQELFIAFIASLGMALLLVFLIKKITKPLQAINETQRQLIGSMSHELKTPLTAIKGYSETLLRVKLSKEQQEKSLNYIFEESGRLSRLSEKMMELTRLSEPEYKIMLQEVSVEILFEAVEKNVAYKLKEAEMKLVKEGNYQGKIKKMDSDLMTSFLINLINNSIMASEPGSHIYLGGDEKSLWVRDEGCGILAEEVDKIRKAFYRVDKSRSRKSGNMGLGLAICEQIAVVHHGRMEIQSKVGRGTKISLVF